MGYDDWLMQGEPGAQSAQYEEAFETWAAETYPEMDWNNQSHVENAMKAFDAHIGEIEDKAEAEITASQLAESAAESNRVERADHLAAYGITEPDAGLHRFVEGPFSPVSPFAVTLTDPHTVPPHTSWRTYKKCIGSGEVTANGRCALGCGADTGYVRV